MSAPDAAITGEHAVAEVLGRYPAAREILARAGLDLCCGGRHPIAFAAQAHGVELEPLLRELNEAIAEKSYGRPEA